MNIDNVRAELAKACERAGSQRKWADANDIATAYVSDVIAGSAKPGDKILAALGLVKVEDYKRVK